MLEQALNAGAGGIALVVVVVWLAVKLITDHSTQARLDAYTERLESRVVTLERDLSEQRARGEVLEAALRAAGIPVPVLAAVPAERGAVAL